MVATFSSLQMVAAAIQKMWRFPLRRKVRKSIKKSERRSYLETGPE